MRQKADAMSQPRQNEHEADHSDPLIDEVRAERRRLAAEFDNDVERFCAHLRDVEREYVARTGPFAHLTDDAAEKVTSGWAAEVEETADPLIDEVRILRERD